MCYFYILVLTQENEPEIAYKFSEKDLKESSNPNTFQARNEKKLLIFEKASLPEENLLWVLLMWICTAVRRERDGRFASGSVR